MNIGRSIAVRIPTLLALGILLQGVPLLGTAAGETDNEVAANAESEDTMAEKAIHVTSQVKGCRAEIFLNDIPLCMLDANDTPNSGDPVAPYVIDGENVLTMVIGPGPTPSTARTVPRDGVAKATPEMEAVATLSYYEEGEWLSPGGGDVQAEIRWSGEKGDTFPLVLTATANLSPGTRPWKWQSADMLTLDDATVASACEAIEKIRDWFFEGKAAPILEMAKHHFKELYVAYPAWPEGMMEMGMAESTEEDAKNPDNKPVIVPRADYDLRLIAGGRMIEAVDKNWQPIIRYADGGPDYKIMIGRINGEWHILR